MKLSARSTALYTACIAGVLMLSACGKNESAANPPAASSTAAAPAATTPAPASTAAAPAKPASAPAPASTAQPAPTAAATAAAAAPTASAPVAAADTTFKVRSVTLGDAVSADHKVSKAKTSFASSTKTIYASVVTEGNTDGATLDAKWSYLEGKGQLVSNISQRVDADGPTVTAFKVQNPNAWPEGKYKVEISLDGKSVANQDFEIKKR